MTDQLRALLVDLADELNRYHPLDADAQGLLARARTALAQPVAEGPTDEELLETMDQAVAAFPPLHPEAENLCAVEYEIALQVRKARAVLARFGHPAPAHHYGDQ